ncbi:MAG: NAD-dependent epimerase/dehydratase family protein [Cyclobacteriaceae bacterium]
MKKVLVTGSAGFIGMHTALKLEQEGYEVIGIDNLNTYYSVQLKLNRLKNQGFDVSGIQYEKEIVNSAGSSFIQIDITDFPSIDHLFEKNKFDYIIHLAAQAGVRYSIENPHAYVDSNVRGFLNILEACAKHQVQHLIYASSSSVYGTNSKIPFNEEDKTDSQVSLYAATKKANESMAHSYSSIYGLKTTGLRFFTVYGPWGRPDMALFKFTKNILENKPIEIYNHGKLSRDFTYIDDIVSGMVSIMKYDNNSSADFADIYNIGAGKPTTLMSFIEELEDALGQISIKNYLDMQNGDVITTFANTNKMTKATGYEPSTQIKEGIKEFVRWYCDYYKK